MPRVFISYRRDDSAGYVGRLYDKIAERFGEESVFMDIDAIQPGEDFVEVIEKAVRSCDVLLAVLGKQWVTITDAHGQRRIDNPDDFVRLEIAAALRRKRVRVIPVLVRGAAMPSAAQLPVNLQPLSTRNAHVISDKNFHRDVDDLIKVLEQIKTRRLPLRWLAVLLMLIGLVLGGNLLGINFSGDDSPSEDGSNVVATSTPEPAPSGILPISGRWQFSIRFDPHPACGQDSGQELTEQLHYRYEIDGIDGDLLRIYVGSESEPDQFWRVEPNTYLLGEYDGEFREIRVLAPDHLEEVFRYSSEVFAVPFEAVSDDPFCPGTVSYFLAE